ncbi:MAG: hypothetical protein OXC58_04475, partial [Acidimicrobiaceae bacterium]|nr:hypothetical protein [Acidimicrobiaceae bacterium]
RRSPPALIFCSWCWFVSGADSVDPRKKNSAKFLTASNSRANFLKQPLLLNSFEKIGEEGG